MKSLLTIFILLLIASCTTTATSEPTAETLQSFILPTGWGSVNVSYSANGYVKIVDRNVQSGENKVLEEGFGTTQVLSLNQDETRVLSITLGGNVMSSRGGKNPRIDVMGKETDLINHWKTLSKNHKSFKVEGL